MNKYLIIVDMQNDFIDGALANPRAKAIVEPILERMKKWDHSIVFTKDTHDENYLETQEGKKLPVPHCIKGTPGSNIVADLYDYVCFDLPQFRDVKIVNKHSFGYSNWARTIREPEYIELCGTVASICVVSNAIILKALFPECEIAVNINLIAALLEDESDKKAAIETMRMCQVTILGETN